MVSSTAAPTESSLRPQLNRFDAVATGLAAILGAGIFSVLAPAAGYAGPAVLISLLIAAVVAFCNAMSSVQLARVLPRTGGTYQYARMMLGPWYGFSAGWMFIVANSLGPGVIAIAFGSYLNAAVPGVPGRLAAIVMALAITLVNASGIRRSVRTTDILVLASMACLLLVAAVGLTNGDAGRLTPFAPHGVRGVLRASGLLFFAYTGYSRIATLVEEVRNPASTLPLATTVALSLAAVTYVLVAAGALLTLGAGGVASSSSPLRETLVVAGLSAGPAIVVAGALVTTFNEALSDLLGVSRVVFAMARGGDLPEGLSRLAPGSNPRNSVLLVGAIAMLVAAYAPFTATVAVSSFGTLLYYCITNVSALKLEPSRRLFPRWLPALGLAGCAALALSLVWTQIAVGLAILALGLLFRVAWLRAHPRQET